MFSSQMVHFPIASPKTWFCIVILEDAGGSLWPLQSGDGRSVQWLTQPKNVPWLQKGLQRELWWHLVGL